MEYKNYSITMKLILKTNKMGHWQEKINILHTILHFLKQIVQAFHDSAAI
jgi:hypothetical protein